MRRKKLVGVSVPAAIEEWEGAKCKGFTKVVNKGSRSSRRIARADAPK